MLLLLAIACPSPDPEALPPVADPSYYADIRPLLDEDCVRCHVEGGLATSFSDPATVVAMAEAIGATVAAGLMPPPAPDPACREYEDADRFTLSAEQKALLLEWVADGAPLGQAETAVEGPGPLPSIGPFDAELFGSVPYAPEFGSDGNDYRCFALDLHNPAPTFVIGAEALVDNAAIVHHVVLFKPTTLGETQRTPDGFACSGFGQPDWTLLAAWAPGGTPLAFPEGVGMALDSEQTVVLQMHYYESFEGADQETDASGYGLLLADAVEREVEQIPYGALQFTIPANSEGVEVSDSERWSGGDAEVLAVFPHMHQAGVGFDMTVNAGKDDEACMVGIDGWNFHNQVIPTFTEPVTLRNGDRVQTTCTYDNPDDKPLSWGEETDEEMCFGFAWVVEAE